jgi:hypothetical protein
MAHKRNKAWSASICLLAALALLLSLCAMSACDKKEESQTGDATASTGAFPLYDEKTHGVEGAVYFEATVIALQGEQILVSPMEDNSAQMAFDNVLVNTTTVDGTKHAGFAVGDKIGILFDGKVAMSLPAQILSIYGFFSVT